MVWKEELKRLSAIVAVPNPDTGNEVLLVGGSEGIIEYRLKEVRLTE